MTSRVLLDIGKDSRAARAGATELSPAEERSLVWAAQQGDADAFGVLVERYYRRVYGVIYRMCGFQEAEDVTQEVFLKALRALRSFQFQGESAFRTWLYRIAVNAGINELRRRGRQRLREGPSLDAGLGTAEGWVERDWPDPGDTPGRTLERGETRRLVWRALEQLPPRYLQALVLVDIEGLPYQEAAQVAGCPLGTLKSRVGRARAAFAHHYLRCAGRT